MERMQQLQSLGLNVMYIWQRDFVQWEKHGRFAPLPIQAFPYTAPRGPLECQLSQCLEGSVGPQCLMCLER
jgi:hypothetical protein